MTEEEFLEDFGRPGHTDEDLEELLNHAGSAGDVDFRLLIKQLQTLRWTSPGRCLLVSSSMCHGRTTRRSDLPSFSSAEKARLKVLAPNKPLRRTPAAAPPSPVNSKTFGARAS